MKVTAFNGSPKKEGNTYLAINVVAEELVREGIDVEIIHVGNKSLQGCLACNKCIKNMNEKCIINDEINEWIKKMKDSDGILLASPVHYSSIGATMKAFLDRAFYVTNVNKNILRHKVGASLVSLRRAGGVAAFNDLNNYIINSEMVIPTSNYWNIIYGNRPGEILNDEEGMQALKVLGKNMAWLLNIVENGKQTVKSPEFERKAYMNFIR